MASGSPSNTIKELNKEAFMKHLQRALEIKERI